MIVILTTVAVEFILMLTGWTRFWTTQVFYLQRSVFRRDSAHQRVVDSFQVVIYVSYKSRTGLLFSVSLTKLGAHRRTVFTIKESHLIYHHRVEVSKEVW